MTACEARVLRGERDERIENQQNRREHRESFDATLPRRWTDLSAATAGTRELACLVSEIFSRRLRFEQCSCGFRVFWCDTKTHSMKRRAHLPVDTREKFVRYFGFNAL